MPSSITESGLPLLSRTCVTLGPYATLTRRGNCRVALWTGFKRKELESMQAANASTGILFQIALTWTSSKWSSISTRSSENEKLMGGPSVSLVLPISGSHAIIQPTS